MNKQLAQEIIKKIEKEKIKQTPKYIFVIKNIIVWLFLGISIFLGAISISISFEYLYSADWYLTHRIGIIKMISSYLPIFWLIFLLISMFFSYLNLKHTQKGYKYNIIKIFLINIFCSVFLSIVILYFGFNHSIENQIENIIPKYNGYFLEDKISRMVSVWQNEDSGLIVGTIISTSDKNFQFTDYNNKTWTVIIDKSTNIKGRVNIEIGTKIKIIGKKMSENEFNALEIRPFMGKNSN